MPSLVNTSSNTSVYLPSRSGSNLNSWARSSRSNNRLRACGATHSVTALIFTLASFW